MGTLIDYGYRRTTPLLDPRAEAMALLIAGVLLMALSSGPSAGESTASSCWSKGSLAMMPSSAATQLYRVRRVCGTHAKMSGQHLQSYAWHLWVLEGNLELCLRPHRCPGRHAGVQG